MGSRQSIRKRRLAAQSLRQQQPAFWEGGLTMRRLVLGNTANINASATVNTAGNWTQLIAGNATTEDAGILLFTAASTNASSVDTGVLVDIGTGASGSEVVRVSGLAVSHQHVVPTLVPIRIPGSTRVAVRAQSSVASRVGTYGLALFSVPFPDRLPLSVDVLGTSSATSVGTAMAGSADSWTEITAATAKDYQALVLVPSASATTLPSGNTRYDLGIGASGAEVVVATVVFSTNANAQVINYVNPSTGTAVTHMASGGFFSISLGFVPSGNRIAVRHNIASSPERCDACVIGVPYV
jgi:hypothetical protein